MCGIVGMAGDLTIQHRQIFKDMLTVCQLRGRDGTGAIRVTQAGESKWVKRVGPPEYLLDSREFDRSIDNDAKILIGHCRSKTFGEVNTKNAHPFEHGSIVGVHNGTLKGHYSWERNRDFDVDSDLLYWHISEYGVENVIPKLNVGGAWALVYHDSSDDTLNFIRNKERPLWFTYSKDMKVLFWASEPWMFGAVHRRIEIWDGGEDKRQYVPLETDKLFSYHINKHGHEPNKIFTVKKAVDLAAEVRGYAGKFSNAHGYSGNTGGYWADGKFHKYGEKEGDKEVTSPFRSARESAKAMLEALDDDLTEHQKTVTLGKPPESLALLPAPKEPSQSRGEFKTISSIMKKSEDSSSNPSDMGTDSKSSSSTSKPKLSLVSKKSSYYPQESKGGTSEKPNVCWKTSRDQSLLTSTSLREVAGMTYITDCKTGREWEMTVFEEMTEGCCCFCRKPVGDLSEVGEIFTLKTIIGKGEESLRFICTSCLEHPLESVM